jgi:serine/threonine-protein phosphatase 2A activator
VHQGFVPAHKALGSQHDLQLFLASDACKGYVAFVLALNQAMTGRKLSEASQGPSEAVQRMERMLDVLNSWVDEIPPETHAVRYGNPAFRVWFARLAEQAGTLLQGALPPQQHPAVLELTGYLIDSFGNSTRIDYGTGHETTFCAFLYCLSKLGVFTEADHGCLVSVVFNKYLALMRRIQTTYWYVHPACVDEGGGQCICAGVWVWM